MATVAAYDDVTSTSSAPARSRTIWRRTSACEESGSIARTRLMSLSRRLDAGAYRFGGTADVLAQVTCHGHDAWRGPETAEAPSHEAFPRERAPDARQDQLTIPAFRMTVLVSARRQACIDLHGATRIAPRSVHIYRLDGRRPVTAASIENRDSVHPAHASAA